MKLRLLAFAICLTLAPAAYSQPPGAPGAGRGGRGGPQIKPVEVNPDRTVTFSFNAPTAKEIILVAGWLPEPMPLVKDEIFTATTKSLEPAIYHYHYTVDGVRGIDPNNPYGQRGAGDATGSMFEVHAEMKQFPDLLTDRAATNKKMKVIWLCAGTTDFALAGSKGLDKILTDHKVKHFFTETPGGHEWKVWRRFSLHEFAPLLFG